MLKRYNLPKQTLYENRKMPLYFKSICSSSSGNCLTLWSQTTRLLIDCGLSSMKRTRQALIPLIEQSKIDSVLLTHVHSDHISYYPLRVLEELDISVHLSEDCADQLKEKHFNGYGFKHLKLRPCKNKKFTIGDFLIKPFEVSHNPGYATSGYEIFYQDVKAVIATDFYEWDSVFDKFMDADFIFVESNHDLGLLEKYYNPNSRYHLPNPKTAELLVNIFTEGRKVPRVIMLGHLSSQRNKPRLAITETTAAFKKAGVEMKFELMAAPLKQCCDVVKILP
jgi:phosphoribosyl 1,2-cyclic phosphodiesterase